jgi:hypothetical protein
MISSAYCRNPAAGNTLFASIVSTPMHFAAAISDRVELHRYYRRDAGFFLEGRERVEAPALDLATVSYNSPLVVHYQAKLLGKYLRDAYTHTVFDNSPPGRPRDAIRELCTRDGIGYVELPQTPFTGNPSKHHGAALNWVCRRYFAARSSRCFGFLDHDIFPCRATSIVESLNGAAMYGRIDERDERWYLWPGFCFYSRARVRPGRLDFLPAPGLDTGGGNWRRLYRTMDRSRVPAVEPSLERLREGGDKQSDMVERMGDWIHTINASEWKDAKGKMDLVETLLRDL